MPSRERKGNKIRVLLCDDHAIVREGTRRLLEEEPDIEVVGEASDGLEAIEMVKKLSPDVVAMDVSMPRMNGVEATKRVKEIDPGISVLALTAYDDIAYVMGLIESGASGYILKSARSEELVQAIRASYLGESVLDAKVAREVFARIVRRLPAASGGSLGEDGIGPSQAPRPDGGASMQDSSSQSSSKKETRCAALGESSFRASSARDDLTQKELVVLKLAANGFSNKEIAQKLGLSPRTVQSHLASIFSKLGVSSRTGAVMAGLRKGVLKEKDIGVKDLE